MTRFCVDCRHYIEIQVSGCIIDRLCDRAVKKDIDLVTGEDHGLIGSSCFTEREPNGCFQPDRCGPEGRFYEAKTS